MANSSSALITDGWFHERNEQWPGLAFSLQVKELIHEEKTRYQDLLVFESTTFGKVLVLDGVIQLTEKDEMSYQEMLVHLPMFAHENPKSVLIVGGGDGGVLREICKHKQVEKIVQCEIDEGVVNAAKRFFPEVAKCYTGETRFTLNIQDAVEYIENVDAGSVDVIIVDSSDPVGPAEGLFSPAFYEKAHRALAPGGILCCQGECIWLDAEMIQSVCEVNAKPFASCEYASIQIPTYTCGQIGALMCQKSKEGMTASCRKLRRACDVEELRYYTPEMHEAAFALPKFIRDYFTLRPSVPSSSSITSTDAAAPATDKWLEEKSLTSGLKIQYQIEKTLASAVSEFQTMELVDLKPFGRTLVIDGLLASSRLDEFVYHECMVHPSMLLHPTGAKTVFIGGGGEGSTAREVLRHKTVEKCVMVDIDAGVVDFCRTHLSENKAAFADPRLDLIIEDAKTWIENSEMTFDVIIMDLSEPLEGGPCYKLYTTEFYATLKSKLNPGGIIVVQSSDSGLLLHHEVFSPIHNTLRSVFDHVFGYSQFIDSFLGDWGWNMAALDAVAPSHLSADKVDALIAERIQGELGFLDGQSWAGLWSLGKRQRQTLKEETCVMSEANNTFKFLDKANASPVSEKAATLPLLLGAEGHKHDHKHVDKLGKDSKVPEDAVIA